jgi:hypothetical protein
VLSIREVFAFIEKKQLCNSRASTSFARWRAIAPWRALLLLLLQALHFPLLGGRNSRTRMWAVIQAGVKSIERARVTTVSNWVTVLVHWALFEARHHLGVTGLEAIDPIFRERRS